MERPERKPISTDQQIRALKAEGKASEHALADGKGLRIRVAPSGLKSWVYRYRNRRTGALELMVLGHYPEMSLASARAEVIRQRAIVRELGSARQHRDLERKAKLDDLAAKVAAERQVQFTVGKLIDSYLAEASKHLKSWREVERALRKYAIPAIGSVPADKVTRSDVIVMLDKLNLAGRRVMANRTLAYLNRCFNWAIRRDLVSANPCFLIERNKERPKERYLNNTEIKRLLTALPESGMDDAMQGLYQLILLTGMRPGEVAALSFENIDADAMTIHLGTTKNNRAHVIPLSPQAMRVVNGRRGTSPWLFPMKSDIERHIRSDSISGPLRAAQPRIGVDAVTPHDLRRTFATGLARIGAPRLLISLALNHSVQGVTSIYDRHGYESELRQWYEAWGAHVDSLCDKDAENKPGQSVCDEE